MTSSYCSMVEEGTGAYRTTMLISILRVRKPRFAKQRVPLGNRAQGRKAAGPLRRTLSSHPTTAMPSHSPLLVSLLRGGAPATDGAPVRLTLRGFQARD